MANNHNPNTRLTSVNRRAADEFQYKAHAEDGICIVTDTNPAPEGYYYGFIVMSDAVLSSITLIDSSKITGGDLTDITTFYTGFYQSVPGGFTTLTLTSGEVELLIYIPNKA